MPNTLRDGRDDTPSAPHTIEFVDVSFRYPGSDAHVLRHINLRFSAGTRLALVGENGSGKTTLVKLLLRLYDPTEGEILLDGIDIRTYEYDAYLRLFSTVFQDFQLHAYSIRENLAFLQEDCDAQLWQALESNDIAGAIRKLPLGLDTYLTTELDEDGSDLSGGEKQKLAMARACYKNAGFFVLDEPTAAIDPLAELRFFQRIHETMRDKAILFVSHRMASTKFADEIIVLQHGEIVERGDYARLIEAGGVYATSFLMQASLYQETV